MGSKCNVLRVFGFCEEEFSVFGDTDVILLSNQCVYKRAQGVGCLLAFIQAQMLSDGIRPFRSAPVGFTGRL